MSAQYGHSPVTDSCIHNRVQPSKPRVDGDLMKSNWVLIMALLMFSGIASAQSTAANPGGFLNTDPRSPYYNSGNNLPPAPAQERWADRWGAIATDADSAKLGAVVDMTSEKQARSAALKACKDEGGVNCTVDISYYNRCAVLVTGDNVYTVSSAATIDEATKSGFIKCDRDDVNCRVYYSGCSLPARMD